uniref:Uncharacterized protein n=1 Tax=Arundo donax TaxID=35708 RepID=A0A0A9FPV8_ARUDO
MKNWVYHATSRQFQFVSSFTNLAKNFERAKIFKCKLGKRSVHQRMLSVRLQFQKNLVANLKSTLRTLAISINFHLVLGSNKLFFEHLCEQLSFLDGIDDFRIGSFRKMRNSSK